MDIAENKSLAKIFDLRHYALSKRVMFNIGELGTEVSDSDALQIPIGIVYRLYFLGRAYNFSAIKLVEPQGRSYLGYNTCQQLIVELEQLQSMVSDPVAEHYVKKLINFLINNRVDTEKGLLVRSM